MEHQHLSTREAAAYLGLSERTLEKLRIAGGGPEYYKPNRRVVYDRSALDAWLAGKRRRSTSDEGTDHESKNPGQPLARPPGQHNRNPHRKRGMQ